MRISDDLRRRMRGDDADGDAIYRSASTPGYRPAVDWLRGSRIGRAVGLVGAVAVLGLGAYIYSSTRPTEIIGPKNVHTGDVVAYQVNHLRDDEFVTADPPGPLGETRLKLGRVAVNGRNVEGFEYKFPEYNPVVTGNIAQYEFRVKRPRPKEFDQNEHLIDRGSDSVARNFSGEDITILEYDVQAEGPNKTDQVKRGVERAGSWLGREYGYAKDWLVRTFGGTEEKVKQYSGGGEGQEMQPSQPQAQSQSKKTKVERGPREPPGETAMRGAGAVVRYTKGLGNDAINGYRKYVAPELGISHGRAAQRGEKQGIVYIVNEVNRNLTATPDGYVSGGTISVKLGDEQGKNPKEVKIKTSRYGAMNFNIHVDDKVLFDSRQEPESDGYYDNVLVLQKLKKLK